MAELYLLIGLLGQIFIDFNFIVLKKIIRMKKRRKFIKMKWNSKTEPAEL